MKVPHVNKFTSKVELWGCSDSGSRRFVAKLHHLWNVQTVAICTDVVSVSFRVLYTAAERDIHNKHADIYSIEVDKSFSMDGPGLHSGACPCGSLEINLNIPNHTNCLFFPSC